MYWELIIKGLIFFVGWGPYAYFQVLEAARAQGTENGAVQRPAQVDNGEEEEDGGFMGLHLVDNPSMRREEDVETGRGWDEETLKLGLVAS